MWNDRVIVAVERVSAARTLLFSKDDDYCDAVMMMMRPFLKRRVLIGIYRRILLFLHLKNKNKKGCA